MASVVLSVRVDEALAGWVVSYAEERGASRQAVLLEAVQQFRESCEGGVPDLAVEPAVFVQVPEARGMVVAPAAREDFKPDPGLVAERRAQEEKAVPASLRAKREANRRAAGEYQLPKIAPRGWAK